MPAAPKWSAFPAQYEAFQSPEDCHRAYNRGWMGCIPDEKKKEEFRDIIRQTSGFNSFAEAAHANGFAGSGRGKLILGHRAVQAIWPDAFPGMPQQTGCCVSMSTRNALLMTYASLYFADKRTPHGLPDVPPSGTRNCVFSNAPIYWFRGYNGDGWSCQAAAIVAVKNVGLVPCRPYDGFDLTDCNAHNDHLYGARQPGEEVMRQFGDHRAKTAAEIHGIEELADALANGFGVSTCGGEGFSGHRNEDGVMQRQGGWSHAMHEDGIDWRDSTVKKYGEPLVLYEQSWGMWGSGPRTIRGTDMLIPEGFFWVKWSDVKSRYRVAFSGTTHWEPKPLTDYGMKAAFN